jgi:hypothetical protein
MRARCGTFASVRENVKRRYADRGIEICEEWRKDPWSFIDWANANGFDPSLTIDRIDNDKGYSPENCRWVDRKTQSRNTGRKRRVVIDDGRVFDCIADAAEAIGASAGSVHSALHDGYRASGHYVKFA